MIPLRVTQRTHLEINDVTWSGGRNSLVISSDLGKYICLFQANIDFDNVILCVDEEPFLDFFPGE